jgi:hypothetical protein
VSGKDETGRTEKASNLLAEYLPRAARAWIDGLGACKAIWNPETKRFEETDIPDHKIRGDMAEKIWHNVIGKPIERSMEVTGSYKELSVLVEEIRQSPEAMRLLPKGLFDSLLSTSGEPNSEHSTAESPESKPAHEGETNSDSEQKGDVNKSRPASAMD